MTVDAKIEVVGLKDALREINKINPSFRREITKEFKNIADPVVKQAQGVDIERLALSGFKYSWMTRSGYQMFPLNPQRLTKFVVTGTSGKKPKEFRGKMQNASVFFIRWKSPQATLLEMAVKGQLGRNMVAKNGDKGRVLWRSWEQNEAEVMRRVKELVDGIMKMYTVKMRKM